MIELFLAAALALPVPSFQSMDQYDSPEHTREAFLKEYKWLIEILKREYPGNEFLILPLPFDQTPPGWTWVPFGWRGHLIYRRPIKQSA